MRTQFVHRIVLILGFAFALTATVSRADVPTSLCVQGYLDDVNTGLPVDDSVEFCVAIFDDDAGGTQVWPSVGCCAITADVEAGLFALTLGELGCEPLTSEDFAGERWAEVSTNGEVMSPRIKLRSVPYALRVPDELETGTEKAGSFTLFEPSGFRRAELRAFADDDIGNNPSSSLRLYDHSNQLRVNLEGGITPACACPDFGGLLTLYGADANGPTATGTASMYGGASGSGGSLHLSNGQSPNQETVLLEGFDDSGFGPGEGGGHLRIRNSNGVAVGALYGIAGSEGNSGTLQLFSGEPDQLDSTVGTTRAVLEANGVGQGGRLALYHPNPEDAGEAVVAFGGSTASPGGIITMENGNREQTIALDAMNSTFGAGYFLLGGADGGRRLEAWAGEGVNTPYSSLRLFNDSDTLMVNLESGHPSGSAGGNVQLSNKSGIGTALLIAGGSDVGEGAKLAMKNSSGADMATIFSNNDAGDGGSLHLYSADGVQKVDIRADDGSHGATSAYVCVKGSIYATDTVLDGCDVAEAFEHSDPELVQPGMVMVIDSTTPGHLSVSASAYDKRVAGIVSGAGDVQPGVKLGRRADGSNDLPIALTGRVYCYVDATEHAVEIGDMLTTSNTPGHAMKAVDHDCAFGAVLGKAMESLPLGQKGLILVLVGLQ